MARTKESGMASAVKGGARHGKKRVGTRGATFKDAPTRSTKGKMVKRYIEPVEVKPVESMDTGSTSLSFESPNPSRKAVPIKDVPWNYKEREEWVQVSPAYENYRKQIVVVKDAPKERGLWCGAGSVRATDKRKLSKRYEVGRSDKASIGKIMPTTDKTPVIEPVAPQYK
jgi:hypothetical protein